MFKRRHLMFSSPFFVFGLLSVLLLASIVLAAGFGPVSVPFQQTLALLLEKLAFPVDSLAGERERLVVEQVRLPRVLAGALVGAALGISGASMQGLFRNPLVEPGYVGVSSGAAAGAVCALYFGLTHLGVWLLPAAAFTGALLAVGVILAVWRWSSRSTVTTLLLLGIGLNALLSAVINILIASSRNEQELRSIIFWLQGGLEARTWGHVQLIAVPILISCVLLCAFARDLNLLLLGDEHAQSSGMKVRAVRYLILGLASLMTGSAVAVSGIIGFVGLVVPHMIRLWTGPDHRVLLPASALGGAVFLVVADLISRMVLQPVTLQVGVVCAIIGAPLFLGMVLKSGKGAMA